MKEWRGWQFPDTEHHLIGWMQQINDVRFGRPTYQASKYDAALELLPRNRRRCAIDIGANIGLWSWLMVQDFRDVQAFEPVPTYADCWERNVPGTKATLWRVALGAEIQDSVDMVCRTPGSCGDTTVDVGQGGERVASGVAMRTLDQIALHAVDLIKVDAEGYELHILQGAAETLLRCKPVVIVEQKPGHGETFGLATTAAVTYLEGLGMILERVISGDYVMRFR